MGFTTPEDVVMEITATIAPSYQPCGEKTPCFSTRAIFNVQSVFSKRFQSNIHSDPLLTSAQQNGSSHVLSPSRGACLKARPRPHPALLHHPPSASPLSLHSWTPRWQVNTQLSAALTYKALRTDREHKTTNRGI